VIKRSLTPVLLVAAFAASSALGCAAVRDAETPAQKFFAAQGTYNIALQVAVNYAESPGADPEVVRSIAEIDQRAQQAIVAGQTAVRTEDGDTRDRILLASASALQRLTAELRTRISEGTEASAALFVLAGPGAILVLLKLLDVLAVLLASYPGAKDRFDRLSAKVRTMVEEGRDPTDEEWDELNAETRELSDRLQAAAPFNSRSSTASAPPEEGT